MGVQLTATILPVCKKDLSDVIELLQVHYPESPDMHHCVCAGSSIPHWVLITVHCPAGVAIPSSAHLVSQLLECKVLCVGEKRERI